MRRLMLAGLVTAVVMMAGVVTRAADGLVVESTGAAPGSVIEIAMDGAKISQVSTNAQGGAMSMLDYTDMPKNKIKVSVYVRRCKDGKTVRILFVVEGNTVPKDEDCDETLAGWFWADKATRLVINVAASTLQVIQAGMSAKTIAIAAALGAGVIAASGGGSNVEKNASNTPTPPSA